MLNKFRYCFPLTVLIVLLIIGIGCSTKAVPDEELNIEPTYLALFNSVSNRDTISFENATGKIKAFVIANVDSIIRNEKGGFINELPYKLLFINLREISGDTTRLDRPNRMYVNRDPTNNKNSFYVEFENMSYITHSLSEDFRTDTIGILGRKYTNYYFFAAKNELKRVDDVEQLYMTISDGILGFKTLSGEWWVKAGNSK